MSLGDALDGTWSKLAARVAGCLLIIGAGMALAADASAQQAEAVSCGGVEQACSVALGTYHAALPEAAVAVHARHPALLFFHGAGQSGAQVLRNDAAMVRTFTDAGYVVILPNGLKRPDSRFGPGWSFLPQRPAQRDEMAFAHELIADAAARFAVDPGAVLVSGFSIGASLAWYLACKEPQLGFAYAPVAGGFWRPLPESCAGPVRLLHTHGWRDQTVPLEGRPLRDGAIYQGDIFAGLAIWRETNGCSQLRADRFDTDGPFWRRVWDSCAEGTALELALHTGGHEVPAAWAAMAVEWADWLRHASD